MQLPPIRLHRWGDGQSTKSKGKVLLCHMPSDRKYKLIATHCGFLSFLSRDFYLFNCSTVIVSFFVCGACGYTPRYPRLGNVLPVRLISLCSKSMKISHLDQFCHKTFKMVETIRWSHTNGVLLQVTVESEFCRDKQFWMCLQLTREYLGSFSPISQIFVFLCSSQLFCTLTWKKELVQRVQRNSDPGKN